MPHIITREQNVKVYERPGTAVKKGKLIGHIPSWGPYFNISFDMRVFGIREGWRGHTNVFSFKATDNNCCSRGDRAPAVFLHKEGRLHIVNSVSGNGHHQFKSPTGGIQSGKWYKVFIQQVPQAGKVRMDILYFEEYK